MWFFPVNRISSSIDPLKPQAASAVGEPLNRAEQKSQSWASSMVVDLSGKDCPEQSTTITKNNQASFFASAFSIAGGVNRLTADECYFLWTLQTNLIGFTN